MYRRKGISCANELTLDIKHGKKLYQGVEQQNTWLQDDVCSVQTMNIKLFYDVTAGWYGWVRFRHKIYLVR